VLLGSRISDLWVNCILLIGFGSLNGGLLDVSLRKLFASFPNFCTYYLYRKTNSNSMTELIIWPLIHYIWSFRKADSLLL
jgi:hypothetical protein